MLSHDRVDRRPAADPRRRGVPAAAVRPAPRSRAWRGGWRWAARWRRCSSPARWPTRTTATSRRRDGAERAAAPRADRRVESARRVRQTVADARPRRDAAPTLTLEFHLGLDGISVALIVLTALLSVSCVLISWNSIREREAEFYVALLVPGSRAVRRVLRVRPDAVLRVLRVHARAAVLPDRHLGRSAAAAGGDQVLPLHARRQPGHAAGRRDAGQRRGRRRARDAHARCPTWPRGCATQSARRSACRSRCS